MAFFDTTRSHGTGRSLMGRLAGIGSIFSLAQELSNRHATRKVLGQLSDRELDDIGLVRGDIEDIAR